MSQPAEQKPLTRWILFLVFSLGTAIGAAPFMALLGRGDGWLIILLTSMIVLAITLYQNHRLTYHRPNAWEYILAGFDFTFATAMIGLIGTGLYYLLLLLTRFIESLVRLGPAVEWNEARIAYLITMVLAVPTYMLISWTSSDTIITDLAPETAGLRSPYYYLLTADRKYLRQNLIWDVVALLAILAAGMVWIPEWLLLILLELFLFFGTTNFVSTNIQDRIKSASGPKQETEGMVGPQIAQTAVSNLFEPGKRSAEVSAVDKRVTQVAQLFEAAGWQVERQPRTQDPEIDPLLVDIDLLATREGRGMLVDVSTTKDGAPFSDTQRPSAIIQAVWLLSEARGLAPDAVAACLVLVDSPVDDRVAGICKRMAIHLLLLDSKKVAQLIDLPKTAGEERARMAADLLQMGAPVTP